MKAMTRYARTAMTVAQNSDRIESIHRAEEMGLFVRKQWIPDSEGIKYCDFIWKSKLWELKSPQKNKSPDQLIEIALKQIKKNPRRDYTGLPER